MAKYLGEKLALDVNPGVIIIRTSWLYGGEIIPENAEKYPDAKQGIYKNFVNTMLRLSEKMNEVSVVADQSGRPTDCKDLSGFIANIIDNPEEFEDQQIFHFSSPLDKFSITWADFAEEIFAKYQKNITVKRISSDDFASKAKRPKYSILLP